ncbi:MAG: hypothetical protein JST04_10155 [Bdellovibrionales bacterium]|nr:hypothetical protein [Bdellovibrionales bacterium]
MKIQKAIATALLLTTSTTFAAPPVDYAAAGRNQGSMDATQQAKQMGRQNGLEDGKNRGYKDGYDDCADQMRRQAQQNGDRQGDRDATVRASTDGSDRGTVDGQQKGSIDGNADGDARSNQDAMRDATPKGTADGIAEANRTDAAARGTADGKVAGDAAAKSDANAREYQPARDQYKKERYAESIKSESTIDLGAPAPVTMNSAPAPKPATVSTKRGFADTKSASSAALLQARLDALTLVQSAKVAAGNGPGDPTIPDVKPTQAADKALTYCKANAPTVAVTQSVMSLASMMADSPRVIPSGRPSGRPNMPGNPGGNQGGGHPGGGNPNPAPSRTPVPHPTPVPSTTPPPTPPTQSEFEKCIDTYKPAYEQAFVTTFKTEYVAAYKPAFDQMYPQYKNSGCQAARKADYRRDYDQAYRRSYDETYRLVFDRVYRNIYQKVYGQVFAQASADSYNANYQGHYQTHYANAKAKAFADRQDQLYTGAYNSAKDSTYAAKYPGYKQEVVTRGRADEAAEFTRIPVRLIGLAAMESVKDGIQEPGEKITVDMDLRNFSDSVINSADLDIRAVAKTSGVALPGSVTILPRNLSAKSLTHIKGALDIRMDESALGQTSQVEIQISVKGNRLATETINLNARNLTTVSLIETPVARLGYPGDVKVRVTNQSQLVLPEDATLGLTTNMQGVTFSKTSEAINGLAAGESRDISFPFTNESYDGQTVNFVASLNLASGRRVGVLNESRQVPSLQDYQFKMSNGILLGDISDLKKDGKHRLKVYITNISSRVATGQLTLTASIIGPNASNFSFTKGQQDSFSPIKPGQEVSSDKMVVKAAHDNSGGTFVLEVREGGKLLGRFKQNF